MKDDFFIIQNKLKIDTIRFCCFLKSIQQKQFTDVKIIVYSTVQ